MKKDTKNGKFDVSKIFTEDFDYLPEKEERRQKWNQRRKKED